MSSRPLSHSLPVYDITKHQESMEKVIDFIVDNHNKVRPSSKRSVESSKEELASLLRTIQSYLVSVSKECPTLAAVHGYYTMDHDINKKRNHKNIETYDCCICFKFVEPILTPYPSADNYATYIINVSLCDVYRRYKKKAYVSYF